MEAVLKNNQPQTDNLEEITNSFKVELVNAKNLADIEKLRIEYLGKSGKVTEKLKTLGSLPIEQKKIAGQEINSLKNYISEILDSKKSELEKLELDKKLSSEKIDVTISVTKQKFGKIHSVSRVLEEVKTIFANMGFITAEGPEIESDYNNFTALNISENHPARQMHDTFYVDKKGQGAEKFVLRTHTSPVQIRTMSSGKPPFKFIAPGRTFRSDMDQTHSPMFHQIEGFYVDKEVNMGHLKGCLQEFLEEFFETKNIEMRFRSSFFPFTEPSAEVDIKCTKKAGKIEIGQGDDFLEILGCGMIHPKVLENCGIDSKEYSGFAFGIGIERLAMLKYGISDLRQFYENDIRFLNHYGF